MSIDEKRSSVRYVSVKRRNPWTGFCISFFSLPFQQKKKRKNNKEQKAPLECSWRNVLEVVWLKKGNQAIFSHPICISCSSQCWFEKRCRFVFWKAKSVLLLVAVRCGPSLEEEGTPRQKILVHEQPCVFSGEFQLLWLATTTKALRFCLRQERKPLPPPVGKKQKKEKTTCCAMARRFGRNPRPYISVVRFVTKSNLWFGWVSSRFLRSLFVLPIRVCPFLFFCGCFIGVLAGSCPAITEKAKVLVLVKPKRKKSSQPVTPKREKKQKQKQTQKNKFGGIARRT